MNGNLALALLNICRTCLRQFPENQIGSASKEMQSIFEVPIDYKGNTSIMEMLKMVKPDIKVDIADKLPTSMCSECIKKLLVSYEFIEMYKTSDKHVHTFVEKDDFSDCEKDFTEESFYKDDIYGINKYALEIEELNIKCMGKVNVKNNTCPVLEKKLFKESARIRTSYFTNPYSDDSENEWIPQKCR